MKKGLLSFLFFGIMVMSYPCSAESKLGDVLIGNHKLIKLSLFSNEVKFVSANNTASNNYLISNEYLIVNGNNGAFAWVGNKHETFLSSLEVSRIRIEYGQVEFPQIRFCWTAYNGPTGNMMERVIYAVITFKKEMKLEKE